MVLSNEEFEQRRRKMMQDYQQSSGKPVNFPFAESKPEPQKQQPWTAKTTTNEAPKAFALPETKSQWTETSQGPQEKVVYSEGRYYGTCKRCGLNVPAYYVEALDCVWHANCFCCVSCAQPLSGDDFVIKDNSQPWCKPCNTKAAPPCGNPNCQKPVTGKILHAMDKTFHPDCFVCYKCGTKLDEFSEYRGFAVCFRRCPQKN